MKKLLFVSFLIMALVPAMCLAADDSHAAATGAKVDTIVAIGDASSGYLTEVSSTSGALHQIPGPQAVGTQREDGIIYTGACRVLGIHLEGPTAGDYAEIYDGTTTAGTFRFDPRIAANTSSLTYDCFGAPFTTGIYVDGIDNDVITTVIYDY